MTTVVGNKGAHYGYCISIMLRSELTIEFLSMIY